MCQERHFKNNLLEIQICERIDDNETISSHRSNLFDYFPYVTFNRIFSDMYPFL